MQESLLKRPRMAGRPRSGADSVPGGSRSPDMRRQGRSRVSGVVEPRPKSGLPGVGPEPACRRPRRPPCLEAGRPVNAFRGGRALSSFPKKCATLPAARHAWYGGENIRWYSCRPDVPRAGMQEWPPSPLPWGEWACSWHITQRYFPCSRKSRVDAGHDGQCCRG